MSATAEMTEERAMRFLRGARDDVATLLDSVGQIPKTEQVELLRSLNANLEDLDAELRNLVQLTSGARELIDQLSPMEQTS